MEKAEVFIHVSDAVFIAFRLRVPLLVWMHLLPLRLGRLNRALTVDRFLDAGCRHPLSLAL